MNILGFLLSYLLLYKYVALGVVVYAGAALLPLPVNAMLLAVGAFSTQGYFNFWIALAIAVGANTLGDLTGYGLARHYGTRVTNKLKLNKFKLFEQLQLELRRDAAITVFMTRFAGWLSTATNFLAGLVGVPFATFVLYDFIGNFIEPGAALLIGRLVGGYWTDFSNVFELFGVVVALTIIFFFFARIRKRIEKNLSSERE